MSLLQKASIITTPTAYAEDYLYSIKPAYALGENLVSNGGFDTDSDWSKTTGWTISGGKANWNPAVAPYNNDIYRAFSFVEGTRYRITFTMSNNTTGRILLRLSGTGNQDVNGGYTYYANGTHTVEFKAQANKSFLRIYGHDSYSSFSIDDFSLRIITDADFDFTRNSTGTRLNEDYLIEDVPYNLVTYSQDFSQWSKSDATITNSSFNAPDGTETASTLTTSASGGTVQKNLTVSNGNVTFSVFVKKGTTDGVRLRIDAATDSNGYFNLVNNTVHSSTNGAKIENYGNGWYRVSISDNITSFVKVSIYTTDGTTSYDNGTLHIWGAQIVKGDQPKDYLKTTDRLDIPRIDYTNGEPSILLEPSRTNKLPYSQDFTDSGWLKSGSTISTGFLSPEGINNASKLTATNTDPYLLYSVSGITDLIYAASIYIKGTSTSIGKTARLWIIRDNVVFHSEDFTITNIWQRISTTKTFTSTPTSFVSFRVDLPNTDVAVGNETLIYGAQLEVGSYATSLIHTSGSAVTRSADAANNAGNSDLINSTEGVLYAEIKALANPTSQEIALCVSEGQTGANRLLIRLKTNGAIGIVLRAANNTEASIDSSSLDQSINHKVAVKFKVNDIALWIDGSQVGTDTSANVFSANTLNEVSFNQGNNSNQFYGNAKSVMVFKEALTDLELEKLTGYNNHELYMNYYNRLSYLGLAEEYNVESDINNYIL